MAFNGIDVSNHQKGLRLAELPRLDLAVFKASQGTQYPDAYFEGFMRQALELGIPRTGGYWWVESHLPIPAQLDVYLRKVESFLGKPGFRMFVDWEPRNPERIELAMEAVDRLKTKTGGQPHIYMNRSTAHRYRWQPMRDLGAKLWLAQYAHMNAVHGFQDRPWHQVPAGWETALAGLQYTDKGRLPGFGGPLDLNRFWEWPGGDFATSAPVPVAYVPDVPVLRENDPPVTMTDSEGRESQNCICMKMIMPVYDAKLREAGLVIRGVDIMQGGYRTNVAASAFTHAGGGVGDIRPLRNDRLAVEIGQRLGIIVFIRRWPGNEHYHLVLLGCPHQHQQAEDQLSNPRIGYLHGKDGLARPAAFVGPRGLEPSGGWVQAYRASAALLALTIERDDVPKYKESTVEFDHHGITDVNKPETGWMLPPGDVVAAPARDRPHRIAASATVHVPEGVQLKTRWVSWSGKEWVRYAETEHATSKVETAKAVGQAEPGADLRLDIWCDRPCKVWVQQSALGWEV